MGWLSSLGHVAGSALRSVSAVTKIPVVGKVIQAVPFVGTAATVAGLGMDLFGGSRSPGLLPTGTGGGLPALPGTGGGMGYNGIPMGDRSIFRNDPNVAKYLEQFALPKAALRPAFRAPKGFVVLHDQVGDPYGLPKAVAKAFGMWKAKPKPPISVRDWHSLQRADATCKKLKKIVQKANHIKGVHVGGHHLAAPKKGKK